MGARRQTVAIHLNVHEQSLRGNAQLLLRMPSPIRLRSGAQPHPYQLRLAVQDRAMHAEWAQTGDQARVSRDARAPAVAAHARPQVVSLGARAGGLAPRRTR